MTNPNPNQHVLARIDAAGRAVFRPTAWKLPALLALGALAMPEPMLRIYLLVIVLTLAIRALPRGADAVSRSPHGLPTQSQTTRVIGWLWVGSMLILAAVVASWFAQGWL